MWLHDKAPGQGPRRPRASATNGAVGETVANTKLAVSNLHYEITPKDLSSIFGQIGTLTAEPHIKYDNSGRSTGNAIITFETAAEATRAKNQFDGILAKGQPMSVSFAPAAPKRPAQQRRASAPGSLMDRIEKAPLLERLTKKDAGKDGNKESGRDTKRDAKNSKAPKSEGPGPIRTRGGRNGRNREPRVKKAKTAEELDGELDAFMGDDSSAKPASAAPEAGMSTVPAVAAENATEAGPAGVLEKDVEMA
jgi:THO complex subunit 4